MTAHIKYLGDLRTEATHIASQQTVITDAPLDNHGKGEAFSPTDLFATSLGSCALTIMGIAARAHAIDISGTEASVLKVMSAAPRRVARIEVTFRMPARAYSEKERKILENAAQTCPVSLSLSADTAAVFVFEWQ